MSSLHLQPQRQSRFSPLSLSPVRAADSFLYHKQAFSVTGLDNPAMSRGNQRDRDRERAQARAGNKGRQSKDDGLTPEQRRERDAKALQEKAARKAAQGGIHGAGGAIRGKTYKK